MSCSVTGSRRPKFMILAKICIKLVERILHGQDRIGYFLLGVSGFGDVPAI